MGKTYNSGFGVGVGTSPQGNISQANYEAKVNELSSHEIKPFDSKLFSYRESEPKYDGYLLKLDHVDGGSKAKFLHDVLGYSQGDGVKLHQAISNAIDGKTPDVVKNTSFGIKYSFNTKIEGKDGKYHSANVTVVVQNDNGKTTWRLITLIPGKKDK